MVETESHHRPLLLLSPPPHGEKQILIFFSFFPPTMVSSLLTLSFLTLLFTLAKTQTDPQSKFTGERTFQQPNCTGRRLHIRKLPPRFNLDLLKQCSDYPVYEDFCAYTTHHGLGEKTHNRSQSWYRTDSLMVEIVFHRRMLEYPCRTPDPYSADAIFVPYYTGIDALRYLYGPDVNSSTEHGLELMEFLRRDSPGILSRNGGLDHFLVMGRPAWDFSRLLTAEQGGWGTSILELPEFYNVTALVLESRYWPWQEQAIPYPISFHPPNIALLESWTRHARRARRNMLMLFAGGGGVSSSPNIRHSIRTQCENSSNLCTIVDCSGGICEHNPARYMKPMLQSTFCLQPPGDTPTRRSTFDGILAGCIPVFFEDQSAKSQYGWHLSSEEFDRFSVFIPKEEVVLNGLKISEVLMGFSKEQVRRMRERVIDLVPKIIYRRHGSSLGLREKKDAFDLAVEGAIQRIKSRLEGTWVPFTER